MEGGRSRLGRLLSKLRGEHHKYSLDKGISFTIEAMNESTGCGSTVIDEADNTADENPEPPIVLAPTGSRASDDDSFTPNIDLRYGGQYLTAEQLPAFCDQLHQLVEVVRNVQSYAQVTGEYPAELERRLEREAREVAALAAETRNARDVVSRTRLQRRALLEHRRALQDQLSSLKDHEVREMESIVRLSDRKLFKSWESLKDSSDPSAFEPLLEEIRSGKSDTSQDGHQRSSYVPNKQTALECLVRLIETRRDSLSRSATSPHPLPPLLLKDTNEESSALNSGCRKRHEQRRANRHRRKEPRSVPLSNEPSPHAHVPQVTLYIQGSDTATRRAALPAAPIELPSGGSVRDILFFTTSTV